MWGKSERTWQGVILTVLLLLVSIFLATDLLARERDRDMDIALVAVGEVDHQVIELLKNELVKVFNKQVRVAKGMPEPVYAFNKQRNQYLSTAILGAITEKNDDPSYGKILGIVDHDLYVPELNFVFGEAGRKAAVISLTRLRQEFYHLPENRTLFHQRIVTEAVHELGHTYGLGHCQNPRCVMFFSNSLMDTDRKGPEFCQRCKSKLYNEK
jgi:archaemetzincin